MLAANNRTRSLRPWPRRAIFAALAMPRAPPPARSPWQWQPPRHTAHYTAQRGGDWWRRVAGGGVPRRRQRRVRRASPPLILHTRIAQPRNLLEVALSALACSEIIANTLIAQRGTHSLRRRRVNRRRQRARQRPHTIIRTHTTAQKLSSNRFAFTREHFARTHPHNECKRCTRTDERGRTNGTADRRRERAPPVALCHCTAILKNRALSSARSCNACTCSIRLPPNCTRTHNYSANVSQTLGRCASGIVTHDDHATHGSHRMSNQETITLAHNKHAAKETNRIVPAVQHQSPLRGS